MGSMSRKFLSLIVNDHTPGFKTLRCIDLTLQKFFYEAAAAAAAAAAADRDGSASSAGGARDAATSRPPAASETMDRVCLPSPSFTFRPGNSDASDKWGMHCFPLGDGKVICVDQSGLALAFDAETRVVGTISETPIRREPLPGNIPAEIRQFIRAVVDPWPRPPVTKRALSEKGKEGLGRATPKRMPFSLANFSFVHFRITPEKACSCDQAIFVMERFPVPEPEAENSGQFEAFFRIYPSGHWIRRLLRPPPFAVLKAGKGGSSSNSPGPVEITAYTVVGGGRRGRVCVPEGDEVTRGICVSAAGAGTYCMNMDGRFPAAWTWTQVGEWTLPFHGKVEYVPELKLWFGFSAESWRLAAADLSGMNSQSQQAPQLVGTWQELDPPKEWKECREPQIVNLGSGRFSIARFFHGSSSDDGETEEDFAVLTCVEMVPCLDDGGQAGDDTGNGKKVMKLRMIKHKSKRLDGGGTIDTVF